MNLESHSVTRVEARMLENKPGELIFLNPDLPAGNYRLEVKSQVYHTPEVRVVVMMDELTVAS